MTRRLWLANVLLIACRGTDGDDPTMPAHDAAASDATLADGALSTRGSCATLGKSCAANDCCGDLFCVGTTCQNAPGPCAVAGSSCALTDCCTGLSCVSRTCTLRPAGCVSVDQACSANVMCCPGSRCLAERCSEN